MMFIYPKKTNNYEKYTNYMLIYKLINRMW